MEDKNIMMDLLNATKGVCDLHLHGTIESATPKVHQAFDQSLESVLEMQNEIYAKMQEQGWYPTEKAEQQQIDKVKQKYVVNSNN